MKRIVLMMAVVLMALTPIRADWYRDQLKDLLTYSGQVSTEVVKSQWGPAIARLMPAEDAEKFTAALMEYTETQLAEDFTDIYLPVYKKYVTEADLKQLMKMYEDERYVAVYNHAAGLLNGLQESPYFKGFQASLEKQLTAIINGEPAKDVSVPSSIPASYKEAFERYYKVSGTDELVDKIFAAMMDIASQELKSQNYPDADKLINDISSYMSRNMQNVCLIVFYRGITENDLTYLVTVSDTEAVRHSQEANKELLVNPMQLARDIMTKMMTWTATHHPEFKEQIQKMQPVLQMMTK